nr:28S ribosomal protein S28, mitochondrial-like [Lytechinus pictus]
MAAPLTAMVCKRAFSLLSCRSQSILLSRRRHYSDTPCTTEGEISKNVETETGKSSPGGPKLTGFAEAFVRHAHVSDAEPSGDVRSTLPDDDQLSFAELFRNSTHAHLGAAHNQIVYGNVFHIVEDDLYIDFGGKFHCVCKRPAENSESVKYHRGARVRLRLKDLELTDHFVGASRDLTLLEADAELLGLAKQKMK